MLPSYFVADPCGIALSVFWRIEPRFRSPHLGSARRVLTGVRNRSNTKFIQRRYDGLERRGNEYKEYTIRRTYKAYKENNIKEMEIFFFSRFNSDRHEWPDG